MSCLYEVHLITSPADQNRLFGYITNIRNPKLINPRPTCANALYGDHPVQPMLTFWFNGTLEQVCDIVTEVKWDMINSEIAIIRTKIEAPAHNEDVPSISENNHYFEFHFKVKIDSTNQWNDIAKIIIPYGGHLFYNCYNKTLNPVVTIRRYTSIKDLEAVYETVRELWKVKDTN